MNSTELLANRHSDLNGYQLACGYLQTITDARQHLCLTLWHESSYYHVRLTHHDSPYAVGWIEWHTFECLSDARKSFLSIKRAQGVCGHDQYGRVRL